MTTKTATAPGSLRAAAFRLAQDLANDATNAAGYAEATYRAIAPARAALSDAERTHAAAKADAELRATLPAQLARALGWPLGIVAETRTDYSETALYLYAAFARGRVTSSPNKYHGTPKGRAYGWVRRPAGGDDTQDTYSYEPAAGTNNPDKLAAQLRDAEINLRAWLAGHTADAWLRAHKIDPAHRPELVELVAMTATARARGYGPERYYFPAWSLTLAGATIAETDDRRAILTPDEERAQGYAGVDAILGQLPAGEEAVTAYAVRHAQRARTALLRHFQYEPERER